MIKALIWKEWRQQRMLVLGVAGSVAIWVMIMILGISIRRGEFVLTCVRGLGGGLIAGFGAIFAIILAAVTSGNDLRKGTDNFWRIRPVSEAKVFWIKFAMGAAIMLLLSLMLIFVDHIQLFQNWPKDKMWFSGISWLIFCYTYPIAMAVFGVTILAMVLTRDTAKAAMLATFFGLLLYFLPLLTSKLAWMNIFEMADHGTSVVANLLAPHYQSIKFSARLRYAWDSTPKEDIAGYAGFTLLMLGTGIAAVKGAISAERRGFRWSPGQKEIVWGIGVFAAFIFGISMFQIRHDLTIGQYNLAAGTEKTSYFDWTDTPDVNKVKKMNLPIAFGISREVCISEKLLFNAGCSYNVENTFFYGFGIYEIDKDQNVNAEPLSYVIFDELRKVKKHSTHTRVLACFTRGNLLYILYSKHSEEDYKKLSAAEKSIYVLKVDISNPSEPRKTGTDTINTGKSGADAIAVTGNYCYIPVGKTINIFKTGESGLEFQSKAEFAEWVPSYQAVIRDKKLLCWSSSIISMFDINDPEHPRMILHKSFQDGSNRSENIGGVTVKNGYLYYSTTKQLHVFKLIESKDGKFDIEEVGVRKATPIERLAGKYPRGLIFSNDMLIEAANNFGLLVYDVSNPARPKRTYHGETRYYVDHIGVWEDRVYAYGGYPVLDYTIIPITKK